MDNLSEDKSKLLNEDWKNYVDVFGEDYDPSQFVNKIEKVSSTQHDIFDFLYDSYDSDAQLFLWNKTYDAIQWRIKNHIKIDNLFNKSVTEKERKYFVDVSLKVSSIMSSFYDQAHDLQNINWLYTDHLDIHPFAPKRFIEDRKLDDTKYNDIFNDNPKGYEYFTWYEYEHKNTLYAPDGFLEFGIYDNENEMIGVIGLTPNDFAYGSYSLHYAIKPKCQNKGYATEAINKLLDTAFNGELERLEPSEKHGFYDHVPVVIEHIFAEVHEDNIASQKTLENLGFKKDAVIRYFTTIKDRAVAMHRYSILKDEWLSVRSKDNG